MSVVSIPRPDVTLFLDRSGVIKDVTLSEGLSHEGVEDWIGRLWSATVGDIGQTKIKRMVDDAQEGRVSGLGQITQRFPSGRELLMEFATVRIGDSDGFVAIGRSLQAVSDLQSRLIEAQQAMERDYWKLREVETRYRLLFTASSEAVLLLQASDLRIVEANPAALRAMGLDAQRPGIGIGREFQPAISTEERAVFQGALFRAREQGKAPGILMHFGPDREAWLVRISLVKSEQGPVFMLQLSPVASGSRPPSEPAVSVEDMLEKGPDGFVAINANGTILHANQAFIYLLQVGAVGSAVGERLSRWVGRPGADVTVLLSNLQRHGVVRLFSTVIHGELGSDTEVEISAGGDKGGSQFGLIVRDVTRRLQNVPEDANRLDTLLGSMTEQVGKTALRTLVRETVGAVERHFVEQALELTRGNRTAAAELLGLSRQSLYAKLDRYGLGSGDSDEASP